MRKLLSKLWYGVSLVAKQLLVGGGAVCLYYAAIILWRE